MKKKLGVYTNNQINKYGYKFSTESIEQSLVQTWNKGTPMFISHDYHRLLGWSNPLGVYISPLNVSLYGISSFCETEKEKKDMQDDADKYLKKINDIPLENKKKLQDKLDGFLSGNEVYMRRECNCVIDNDIVKKVLSDKIVIDEHDKRSLISVQDLEVIAPGVFEIEGYTVFAHRYFRRSLSQQNNLNDIFLKKLLALKDNSKLDVKIAIDPHSIGLKETYLTPSELEYWWGPKFNDSLLDIPTGVTCYKTDKEKVFFHGVSETQFWWHKQNNIQSLECEELRDMPSLGLNEDKYACRYVHSMIDEKTGLAFHLDGAVRIYKEEVFLERLDVDISKAGKNTEYVKLWRIDGEIDISLWKELLNDFYRDNHQVGEYLLGNKVEETKKINVDKNDGYYKVNLVDYLPKSQGVHIFLSYREKKDFPNKDEVEVVSNIIEYSAIDLLKIIKKENIISLTINPQTQYIAFEDMDINYPLIMHRGDNAIALANKTIEYLYKLCELFYRKKEDRIITINIGIEYENQIAIFSFISHIESMYLHYSKEAIKFPLFENIGKWCSNQYNILHKDYNIESLHDSFLNMQGQFQIRRYFINDLIELHNDGTYSLKVKEDKKALLDAVVEGIVKVVVVSIIKKSLCSSCNQEYMKCNCSVFLDENCSVEIKENELIGFVLSTRS